MVNASIVYCRTMLTDNAVDGSVMSASRSSRCSICDRVNLSHLSATNLREAASHWLSSSGEPTHPRQEVSSLIPLSNAIGKRCLQYHGIVELIRKRLQILSADSFFHLNLELGTAFQDELTQIVPLAHLPQYYRHFHMDPLAAGKCWC
jgi:hypothetical protein